MDEAANVVVEVVVLEAAVIVTDLARIAAMTAARTVETVGIVNKIWARRFYVFLLINKVGKRPSVAKESFKRF